MFSALLLTTAFVLILSPTELQQVTDLKGENKDLEKKLTEFMREKSALEGEVGKLKEENEDLISGRRQDTEKVEWRSSSGSEDCPKGFWKFVWRY